MRLASVTRLKTYGMGDDVEAFLDRAVFSDVKDEDDLATTLDRLKRRRL